MQSEFNAKAQRRQAARRGRSIPNRSGPPLALTQWCPPRLPRHCFNRFAPSCLCVAALIVFCIGPVQRAERGRAGQPSAQKALWRTLGAGAWLGQSDVPFDVRPGGTDGHGAVGAAVLNDAKAHRRHWAACHTRPSPAQRAEQVGSSRKTDEQRRKA